MTVENNDSFRCQLDRVQTLEVQNSEIRIKGSVIKS